MYTGFMENQYTVNKDMAWQEINGQILILDSGVNESAHELNEMGSYIFQKIHQGSKTEDILNELIESYKSETSESEIQNDFDSYLKELLELKLILPL